MKTTKIEWTDRTWNPVTGCTKYSAGCLHCYAETMARRLKGMHQPRYVNGFQVTCHPEALNEPLEWKHPSMAFVCSMGDLFHNDVPVGFINNVMGVIQSLPQHTFQILTKRSLNMLNYFSLFGAPPSNAWIGVTVECRASKLRIDLLSQIEGAAVRFLSCEPLLEDLGPLDLTGIDWVIVGGESGTPARPMKEEWVLNIKRQCEAQHVAFFFKQWGTYGPDGIKRNKKANGKLLQGEIIQQMPVPREIEPSNILF